MFDLLPLCYERRQEINHRSPQPLGLAVPTRDDSRAEPVGPTGLTTWPWGVKVAIDGEVLTGPAPVETGLSTEGQQPRAAPAAGRVVRPSGRRGRQRGERSDKVAGRRSSQTSLHRCGETAEKVSSEYWSLWGKRAIMVSAVVDFHSTWLLAAEVAPMLDYSLIPPLSKWELEIFGLLSGQGAAFASAGGDAEAGIPPLSSQSLRSSSD